MKDDRIKERLSSQSLVLKATVGLFLFHLKSYIIDEQR